MKQLKSSKLLIVLIALFAYSNLCRADDNESVVIWQTDGQSSIYQLAQKPVISYSGDSLLLIAQDVSVKLPMSGISKITFAYTPTKLSAMAIAPTGNMKITTDGVSLSGFAAGTPASVYLVNGTLIAHYTVPESGSLLISLAGMRSGLYIIKAGHSTIKITRK